MGESAPAIVVSDLRMLGMDSRELLTRTRQLLGSSAPPFVFLTGLAPEFADAAATFVSKPCDFDQLWVSSAVTAEPERPRDAR